MGDELNAIVQRMIDAGEPEESIAEVIRAYPAHQASSSPVTPMVAAGLGAAQAAPGIVSGINRAAGVVKGAAKSKVGRMAPGVIALDAAGDVMRGDMKGAATSTAATAAASQIPRVAEAVQQSTNPSVQRMVRFMGQLSPVDRVPAGWLSRMAGGASKLAGAATLPLSIASSLYDTYQGGQAHAAKLDDPNRSALEKEEILRQLMSHGGF